MKLCIQKLSDQFRRVSKTTTGSRKLWARVYFFNIIPKIVIATPSEREYTIITLDNELIIKDSHHKNLSFK